jgi:hypothetical protein
MRTYTTDDPAVINDIVQAANLATVTDTTVELMCTVGYEPKDKEGSKAGFIPQARVTARIIPNSGSERDAFGNKEKLYALTATILSDDINSPIAKYDVSYPTTSMLHILDVQLRHLLHDVLGEASALPPAEQDGNISTVDWKAIAEELVKSMGDTTFTCGSCPVKDSCQRPDLAEPCFEYIMRHYSNRHTIEHAGKSEVNWPAVVEELLFLTSDDAGALLCGTCPITLDGNKCTGGGELSCVEYLREYLITKHTK